jgi:hypothetical protein
MQRCTMRADQCGWVRRKRISFHMRADECDIHEMLEKMWVRRKCGVDLEASELCECGCVRAKTSENSVECGWVRSKWPSCFFACFLLLCTQFMYARHDNNKLWPLQWPSANVELEKKGVWNRMEKHKQNTCR